MKVLLSHWSTANVLTRGCHKYFPVRVLHSKRGETVKLLFLCLHKEGFVSQSEEERGQQCEKWRKEWSLCVLKIVNKCKHVCLENQGLCIIQREFILEKGRVNPQLFCSREYFFKLLTIYTIWLSSKYNFISMRSPLGSRKVTLVSSQFPRQSVL